MFDDPLPKGHTMHVGTLIVGMVPDLLSLCGSNMYIATLWTYPQALFLVLHMEKFAFPYAAL